jgi:HlyD family secretion protein
MNEKLNSLLGNKNSKYIIAGIALSIFVLFALKPKKIMAETVIAHKGDLIQYSEEEGITKIIEKFSILSPVSGVLRRVEKIAGDSVKKGEIIAVVDWDLKKELKSPIDGKILVVHRESEGPINMGTPILDIGDTSNQEVVAQVLTQQAVSIKSGNKVTIEGWGGSPIEGTVKLIEPEAFKKVSSLGVEEQRVRVIINFPTPENMGEGFKVLCRIQIGEIKDGILVPVSALFREGDDWTIFRVIDNKARKTKINLSGRNLNFASVLQGLNENDKVILFPAESLEDGMTIEDTK